MFDNLENADALTKEQARAKARRQVVIDDLVRAIQRAKNNNQKSVEYLQLTLTDEETAALVAKKYSVYSGSSYQYDRGEEIKVNKVIISWP